MARVRVSDEVCERLVASRDPIDPARLRGELVAELSRRLGQELVAGLGGELESRGPAARLGGTDRSAGGRRRLTAAAAIAAVVVAAVLVALASLPGGGDHAGQLDVPSASAAVVLDRAAQAAMRMASVAPGPGQYGFVKVETGSVGGMGTSVGTRGPSWTVWVRVSEVKSDWYGAKGSGRERIVRTSTSFLSRHDRAVARAHRMTLASAAGGTPRILDGAFPPRTLITAGVLPYWKMNRLPTAPGALRRALERLLVATAPNREPGPILRQLRADPADLFSPISQFLFLPTSPRLRAALFRVLAGLPGVRLLGDRRDRLGRSGVAVALTLPGGPDRVREELLFDPATSNVLQIEYVQLGTSARSTVRGPSVPAGTVTGYTDFLSRGVVNSITRLPDGRRLPIRSAGSGR